MGLNGLDSALSGLRIAQQQLNVVSDNVANASTPGYTRKILPQETLTLGGITAGVKGSPIIRKVDLNLERDLWTQVSTVSSLDVTASYLNRIQEFHGPPNLDISIASEMSALRDSFSGLADSPEDTFLQSTVVTQAQTLAGKMNDFAGLLNEMRADTQDEMAVSVQTINDKLEQIAELNKQIKFNKVSGKTTAALEDQRDKAINALSQEVEVSFFTRADGVLVVQTTQGVQLADERAESLYFSKTAIGPTSAYPGSLAGIYVGGNPADNPNAIDITPSGLNGNLGALIELRDEILPRQQAMLDELAHKLALRFQAQGLTLFTDASGQIPADTGPDPSTNPPTPVEYVGFAGVIQVNADIVNDNSLVQQGTVTTDVPVQAGSNEVVKRVIEFVFGDVSYQQATGSADLRASGAGTTLQEWLGVFSENQITGAANVAAYSDIGSLLAAGGQVFDPAPAGPPLTDSFNITFEEARTAPPLGPTTITVSLSAADTNFPIGGGINNALDQIVAEINNQIALSGVPAGLAATASVNANGQIIIQSRGDMTVDASFPGGMRQEGLDFLGLTEDTYVTKDPYIDVQVGNDPPVRITVEPGEDETDLVAKLDKIAAGDPGVPGLAVDLDALTGFLTLRPGDDIVNPNFGGDIKIIGGPFEADGTGTIPGGVTAGTGIISALFGTASPITDVNYGSPTSTPGVNVSFRYDELGPGADISTGIISSTNLIEYSQKLVNKQAEEVNAIDARISDETSFRDLLQRRLQDESGVNIDEELSNLIVVQTAYSAAARVISAIDEQFQELLRAI